MISLTMAIQTHNFDKRLSCLLSSLYEQNNKDKYNLTVDIASLKNNFPTLNIMAYFHSLDLNIKSRQYSSLDTLQYRGNTRNHQIADCETDYLVFVDSDMIYHPDFFFKLTNLLEENKEYNTYDGVMTCGRYSQPNEIIEKTNIFVDKITANGSIYKIDNIWEMADRELEKIGRSNVGAGFWQLINMKLCNHGGYYVKEEENKDGSWLNGIQKAKSDQQFRHRIGKKKKMPSWFSENQIHLNHRRDSMCNFHLEEPR